MSRSTKARTLKVVSICPHCKQEVAATTKDKAYRHGFNRYKKSIMVTGRQFSQEDGRACEGSGKTVIFRRATKTKRKI